MTLLSKRNKHNAKPQVIFKQKPYLMANAVFAGVIFLIILYTAIFSPEKNNYPVACIHEKITGEPCSSCGLSHSLSLILRGRIDEAYSWNENGMAVFIFFISQLLLRIFFSRIYIRYPGLHKQLIITDIIGSFIIFLLAFMPFIVSILKWI